MPFYNSTMYWPQILYAVLISPSQKKNVVWLQKIPTGRQARSKLFHNLHRKEQIISKLFRLEWPERWYTTGLQNCCWHRKGNNHSLFTYLSAIRRGHQIKQMCHFQKERLLYAMKDLAIDTVDVKKLCKFTQPLGGEGNKQTNPPRIKIIWGLLNIDTVL